MSRKVPSKQLVQVTISETQVLQFEQGMQVPVALSANLSEGHFRVQVSASAFRKNPRLWSHALHCVVEAPVHFVQAELQGVQIFVRVFPKSPSGQLARQVWFTR